MAPGSCSDAQPGDRLADRVEMMTMRPVLPNPSSGTKEAAAVGGEDVALEGARKSSAFASMAAYSAGRRR